MTVAALAEAGAEVLGETIQELEDFFYAEDGLVAPPRTERLQRALNVLTHLFYRSGLHTNVRKTMSMACWACHTPIYGQRRPTLGK